MRVQGTVRVPGDKSISHRALMLAALGAGASRITRVLDSADVRSTAGVLRALGVDIPALSPDFVVRGRGIEGLRSPSDSLDCGNSGTTTRLMAGIVSAIPGPARFIGDASLSRRPMQRIARPLETMGARFEFERGDGLPMIVHGGPLRETTWVSDTASAQVKSAILLAALTGRVSATVHEPARSRDHTERMLAARGIDVHVNGNVVELRDGGRLASLDTVVPADPSSAAFMAGLAAISDEGEVTLPDVCVNATRRGFLDLLREMGAQVAFDSERDDGGEPVATIRVRPNRLRGVRVTEAQVPSLIDELPLLACLASVADGETLVTGAGELRVKESDRIAAVVTNLRTIGVEAEELEDGMRIVGTARPLRGAVVTHGDHRLAMAFGVLGARDGNDIVVDDPTCVAVSYPSFWRDLADVTAAGSSAAR
jgi:3-phosphoshikimate 1-carboxyvinyltransferase